MTLRKLAPIALFLVVAAACSAADSVVATVGGVDITASEITALRTTYQDTAFGSDFRQDLSLVVFQEVITQALADQFDAEISAADVEAAVQTRMDAVASVEEDIPEGEGSPEERLLRAIADLYGIEGATEELLRRDATSEVLLGRVSEALFSDPAVAEGLLTESPEAVTEVCVRHVLVETEAEALEVMDRLETGEPLADIAGEVSIDTGTPSGDLGCSLAAIYVPEFGDASIVAPLGEAFGPVETQFGFHVLIVDERTTPTVEEIGADPTAFLPPETIQNERALWINEAVRAAVIEVAPNVGSWDPDGLGIAPPAT